MRHADQLAVDDVQVVLHAQRFERELHPALVQQPHDDAFAVQHRDHRDADVDLAAGYAELDAAVLRQPLFRDVEPGHDLEAADDRGLEAVDLRRNRLRMEHAVDAVANLDAGGLRFDVHVARRVSIASIRISLTSRITDASCASSESSESTSISSSSCDVFFFLQREQVVDRLAADAQVGFDSPRNLLPLC